MNDLYADLSLVDSSVLIAACDGADDSFERELLADYGPDHVAYTQHLFAELRISSSSTSEVDRRDRLARLDDLCGIFLNDSDPRGAMAQRVSPSLLHHALRDSLPPDAKYKGDVPGDFGGDLQVLGELVLSEVGLTPIQINNMRPAAVFSDLGEEFRKIGSDIWETIDRAIDDVIERLLSEPDIIRTRTSLTGDGTVILEKRMAVMKWMMMLSLLGYHRDSKGASWHGAFFDGLHTASAIFCKRFITADRRQANRAAASFWRENVLTDVLLVRSKQRDVVTIK